MDDCGDIFYPFYVEKCKHPLIREDGGCPLDEAMNNDGKIGAIGDAMKEGYLPKQLWIFNRVKPFITGPLTVWKLAEMIECYVATEPKYLGQPNKGYIQHYVPIKNACLTREEAVKRCEEFFKDKITDMLLEVNDLSSKLKSFSRKEGKNGND